MPQCINSISTNYLISPVAYGIDKVAFKYVWSCHPQDIIKLNWMIIFYFFSFWKGHNIVYLFNHLIVIINIIIFSVLKVNLQKHNIQFHQILIIADYNRHNKKLLPFIPRCASLVVASRLWIWHLLIIEQTRESVKCAICRIILEFLCGSVTAIRNVTVRRNSVGWRKELSLTCWNACKDIRYVYLCILTTQTL
jgi:hypothetical protein